jgi:hypothetical protein
VLLRPFGASGPYARAEGSFRKQMSYSFFDVGAAGAAAGWQLGRGSRFALVEYGYDALSFGGRPYLTSHRLTAGARLPVGALALEGSYTGRLGQFLRQDVVGYSGLRHAAEAGLSWRGTGTWLGAFYLGIRDLAESPALAHLEHGPRVEWGLRPAAGVQLILQTGMLWRAHDALDPGYGVLRADTLLEAGGALELQLSEQLMMRLMLTGRQSRSNVPQLAFQQWVGSVGLTHIFGVVQ